MQPENTVPFATQNTQNDKPEFLVEWKAPDEYSDPLEVAASAGARLSTPEKASISRKRKVQTNPAEKKRNVRGSVDPNVSAWDRVNEFKVVL